MSFLISLVILGWIIRILSIAFFVYLLYLVTRMLLKEKDRNKIPKEIKIGDYYACDDCKKSCGYTTNTKKNYPYCSKCKKYR